MGGNRCDMEVWNATTSDRARWLMHLDAWPQHELYAHPDYLGLYANPGETPTCLRYHDAAGEVMYPLILRDVERLPFAGRAFSNCFDALTAPFGYGGPFVRTDGDANELVCRFQSAYADWARDVRLVSEYTTFSPIAGAPGCYPGEVVLKMPAVVKDLHAEDLTADIKEYQHRAIRRARRLGVTVEPDMAGHDVGAFLEIFAETRARHGGFSAGHDVSRPFIDTLLERLRGYVAFFHARVDGKIVSSELVLLSGQTIVFFRGGTANDAMQTRANQLLKYEICEWGRQEGYRWYLLGGGMSAAPDDPLFVYKKTFAMTGVRPLLIGKWTADPDLARRLLASRVQHERMSGTEFVPADGYFPAYRAPSMKAGEDAR